MTAANIFSWSPYTALVLGCLAGLGAIRSFHRAFLMTGIVLALQGIVWPAFIVLTEVVAKGWNESWQVALAAGFLLTLMVTLPYTVIGAALSGVVAGVVRHVVLRPAVPNTAIRKAD